MNRNIFYSAFVLIILVGCISNSSGYSNNDVENKNSIDEINWVIIFLLSLFKDPEYLALTGHEQLAVIEIIYSILDSSYIKRKSMDKWIPQL